MNTFDANYLKFLRKASKRFIVLAILFLIGTTLIDLPNPVTHECVPNMRTQMGLSSDGYPMKESYTQHFCKPGYYPVLRFGQDEATAQRAAMLFLVVIPVLGLAPLIYILIARRIHRT